jgi:hypothetical protein
MRRLASAVVIAAAMLISACSIYPLPEDVMPFDSDKIAAVIRCQTRDAVREAILRNIAAATSPVVYERMSRDELLDWLQLNPENFRRLKWDHFVPELRGPFEFYKDTNVSYDFTIDSTEMNTAGVNVTLLKKLNAGSDNIGLVARNDRTRDVKRHFRVFDTFDSVARLMREDACYDVPRQVNLIFPSAGLLKINSLVDSFLLANQWVNLAGDNQNYTTAQMTDTLTFTTKSTGNFDPSTMANPALGKFVPSSAALNLDNFRQDLHTIIILISLPPSTKGLPQFDAYGRILPPGKVGARVAAAAALDQQRVYNTEDALTRLGTGVGIIGSGN